MYLSFPLRRPLLCLIGTLFLSSWAHASSQALSQALSQRDWDKVIILGRQLTGPEIEAAASGPAQAGVVPAMWLMGQARYLVGDKQSSAAWVYQAFLGTRLDLATCRDRRTDGVLYVWTQTFQEAVLAARMNVSIRSQSIIRAARHYEHLPPINDLTGWSCRQAVDHAYIRKGNDSYLFIDRAQWKANQGRAFSEFCREAGLPINQIDTFSTSTDVPLSGL